jgi:RNA polymerase sigma-70 factor (ECF subfamily)
MGELVVEPASEVGGLYEQEGARLWRAVFAYAQDRAVTDDAVAEAFAQCLRRGAEVRDPRAWVWRAAFRLAAGELRDRRRFLPISTDPPAADELGAVEVLGVLAGLPGNQRAAAVLRWYAGFDTREVAEVLGIARGTVRVHLSRARHRLATFLDEEVHG